MRHNRVLERRAHRHAFAIALACAAGVTTASAVLGFLIAFSALAGWVVVGLGAATALSLWMETRLDRHPY